LLSVHDKLAPHVRQKASPDPNRVPQCIQNAPVGPCKLVVPACMLLATDLRDEELRLATVNKVASNNAKEMAAKIANPVSVVVSAVVVVNVDVSMSGSCVEMAVQVEILIDVMVM